MTNLQDPITRRQALGIGVSATLATTTLAACSNTKTTHHKSSSQNNRTRSVIFMVADGMSLGVPTLAEPFSQSLRGTTTNYCSILRDTTKVRSLVDMASADSLVTDSAAASSSWGCGHRINNGAINMTPDGRALTPITHRARNAGLRTALVTTTTITHATPAGFAANVLDRNNENKIAQQYLAAEIDILLGGGRSHFDPNLRPDKLDLAAQFQNAGYTTYQTRAQLLESKSPERMLGLFYHGHLPYTIDHINDPKLQADVPTLAEMTRTALNSLANHQPGFILQIEGGRVDHAAHANDAAGMFHDQLAFDDAIGVVREYQKNHPDTLVIITTDHGTANPGLNGMGARYTGSTTAFEKLTLAKASYGKLFAAIRARNLETATADDIIKIINEKLGLTLEADEATALLNTLNGNKPHELSRQHRNTVGIVGQILSNHNGIGWTGVSHTADYALLTAFGPGQNRFAQLQKNTDIHGQLLDLLNLNTAKTPANS